MRTGRHLRQVGNAQHLILLTQTLEQLADHFGHPAADADERIIIAHLERGGEAGTGQRREAFRIGTRGLKAA
mgnify:CR=1 FL=1